MINPLPTPSDDMLMALADNELHGPEAEALRQRVAADPALAARYAVFADSRAALAAAFAPGPTPDRLVQAILAAPPQAGTAGDSTVVAFRPRLWASPATLALAASLLLAVGVGGFLAGRGAAPQAVVSPGVMAATALASLATGAETTLEGGATARVLGSYQTDQGLCRLIDLTLSSTQAERAVVCREGGANWTVVASVTAGQAEVYIPASDTAAALIDQVLDDLGAGPALEADAEKAALAAGTP